MRCASVMTRGKQVEFIPAEVVAPKGDILAMDIRLSNLKADITADVHTTL